MGLSQEDQATVDAYRNKGMIFDDLSAEGFKKFEPIDPCEWCQSDDSSPERPLGFWGDGPIGDPRGLLGNAHKDCWEKAPRTIDAGDDGGIDVDTWWVSEMWGKG